LAIIKPPNDDLDEKFTLFVPVAVGLSDNDPRPPPRWARRPDEFVLYFGGWPSVKQKRENIDESLLCFFYKFDEENTLIITQTPHFSLN